MSLNFVQKTFTVGGSNQDTGTLTFYKKGFRIGSGSTPTWKDVILSGTTALTLVNAKEGGLNYLKLFGGTEQRNLPKGYTQLEHIVFDSTQVLDTGFTLDNNSRIESKCYRTGTNCWFYGASPNNPRVTLFHSDSGTSRWGNQSGSNFGFSANIEYTIIEDKNGLTINGTLYPWTSGTAGDFTCDRSLTIGNNNGSTGTRYFAGNFYYMKIYDNDVLARDYLPVKRNSDNALGIYDMVNGTFLTAPGFTEGAKTVPTPDEPMDIVCNNGAIKVRHQSGLPLGYQPYEYITASSNQWLDTGIKLASTDIVETEFQNSSTTGYGALYGVFAMGDSSAFYANGTYYGYDVVNNKVNTGVSVDTEWHTLRQDFGNGIITLDGNDTTYTPFEFDNTRDNYLFARFYNNSYGYGFKGSCKRFKVIRNGVLICDLIPVVQLSDNDVGMYDLVNNVFRGNLGTGDFEISNPINDLEIYYDGTVETVEVDTTGDTATAEPLLAVGNYKDVQEVLTGAITRNCEALYYDGTQTINTPYISTTGGLNVGSIIVHPRTIPTTETVTPQPMQIQAGTNIVEITQASLDNLELEVSYKAGVEVTVEEIENAQLDNSVEVTING